MNSGHDDIQGIIIFMGINR